MSSATLLRPVITSLARARGSLSARQPANPLSRAFCPPPAGSRLRAMSPGAAAAAATDTSSLASLESLSLVDSFTAELPGDASEDRGTRQVHGAFYSFVKPTPTGTEPSLVAHSPEVAALIGLDPGECERPEFAAVFAGNAPLPGARPYAQNYGGEGEPLAGNVHPRGWDLAAACTTGCSQGNARLE